MGEVRMTSISRFHDAELENLYRYPQPLTRPWVQANFVCSTDGAATVASDSEVLSNDMDRQLLSLSRTTSDVILVGLNTALIGRYQDVRVDPARRGRDDLSPMPPIALVTARCGVTPESPVIRDAPVPPIVVTCSAAPEERRLRLRDAGVEVIVAGVEDVDMSGMLTELDRRGLRSIDCEGGPKLFASLVRSDLVDELRLTMAPLLAGGDGGRIANGFLPRQPLALVLESVLHGESSLFLRYTRQTTSSMIS
jgi:riboflavin-specific deaminase-like protein